MGLVKLHLVGNSARAVLLIRGILQVPSRLVALNKLSNHLLSALHILNRLILLALPHLQILNRISILILRWPLPGNQIASLRRETQLIHIRDLQLANHESSASLYAGNALVASVCEIATAWRVHGTASGALWLLKAWERGIDGRGVDDANLLEGAVGKLRWDGHG